MSTPWLSNTYLVLDDDGQTAVMIDAGGPVEPLLELIERERFAADRMCCSRTTTTTTWPTSSR